MKVHRLEVFDLCKQIAPKHGFDPFLIMAICEQETEKDKKDPDVYRPDVARLEQNFYRRYVLPADFSTTTEVLLSASYGIMQMMGQSLYERGFFAWHLAQLPKSGTFVDPVQNIHVAYALDNYCEHPEWNIEWGCRHLSEKRKKSGGSEIKMLGLWNGDMSGKYANEVMTRIPLLKKGFA